MSAVMSCGQLKVAGRAFSIGSFSVPAASRDGAITPQTTFTTIRYSAANFARAAMSHAAICWPTFLLSVPAISRSRTTNTVLPAMMAGRTRICGAMPSR